VKSFSIRVSGLRVHARIGASKEEQILGQSLFIDLHLDVRAPLGADLVAETVDYGSVIAAVREFAEVIGNVKLIETFASSLLDQLLAAFHSIQAARVVVQKNYVPIRDFTGTVSVQMERSRS
jgi:dihydroneopterin aldolase